MKKVVIFGGGTGLSQVIKGLKMFPVEITAVVTVADNGSSTGALREAYNIPAVGDISKVLLSMSSMNQDIVDLMNYKFVQSKALGQHSIKNLILTALLDIKGSFDEALPVFEELLDVVGDILPLTEKSVELIGLTESGTEVFGEEMVTKSPDKIIGLKYDKEFDVNPKIYSALEEADLIICSSGSILTSLWPHLAVEELSTAIRNAKAKKLYICNLFTQPGETDDFAVSDHVNMIEKYLGEGAVNAVIVNDEHAQNDLSEKYLQNEQKDFVKIDYENLKDKSIDLIVEDLLVVDGPYYRHDALKTAYLIFSYMMMKDK